MATKRVTVRGCAWLDGYGIWSLYGRSGMTDDEMRRVAREQVSALGVPAELWHMVEIDIDIPEDTIKGKVVP